MMALKKIKSIPAFSIILILILHTVSNALQAQLLKNEVRFADHQFLPFYGFKKMGSTSIFQGNKKKRNYFEGWYFKMVAPDGQHILSVIPGISLSSDGTEQHAFIQIIDGNTSQTQYFSFPISEFSFSQSEFALKIGPNFFSKDSIQLQLTDSANTIRGKIKMHQQVEYSGKKLVSSGIMGWYRFMPFMECLHGVVSLTHQLSGELHVNNEVFNFRQGKGYIEKDWGSSMPSSWIWMQSNHFNNPSSSFMLSIANVPWMRNSFTGFLGFLYFNHKVYKFATYSNSKLHLYIDKDNTIHVTINEKNFSIQLKANSKKTGLLKAPVAGSMDRRIAESIDAHLHLKLFDKKGNLIMQDSTQIAGLEMVGQYQLLQHGFK